VVVAAVSDTGQVAPFSSDVTIRIVSTSSLSGQVNTTLLLVQIVFDAFFWSESVPVPDVMENAYLSFAGFGADADA